MANIIEHIEAIVNEFGTYTIEKGFGEPEIAYKSDTIFIMYEGGNSLARKADGKSYSYEQRVSLHLYDKVTINEMNNLIKHLNSNSGYYNDEDFGHSELLYEGVENNANNLFSGNSILKINLRSIHGIS